MDCFGSLAFTLAMMAAVVQSFALSRAPERQRVREYILAYARAGSAPSLERSEWRVTAKYAPPAVAG